MRRAGQWLVIVLCAASSASRISAQGPGDRPPELVAPTEALSPEQEKSKFRLPPGFEAQLVAAEPDIAKPMNLAFDDMGRLWVTSSYEYPWPVEAGKPARDKVTILTDFGPDSRARRVTTFAEGLNIPIGILPLSPRDALVHSIPNIYHMTDEDGDSKADHQDLYYGAIGFRDTHGMSSAYTWGFDGWIYACHGFANDSTLKGRDGQSIVMNSGNTYRLKPNGMHVEQWTWGQVNPFGLTFDPMGNLYSVDCHTRPIFQLLRGAHYDSFGKPHDGLGYGPEMMQHDHASTGIAGICYYAADAYPKAYQDTIFIGNVVTSRINRDRLEWHGSSPRAVAEDDFLKSDDPWFRPVDIELGPDGNLYIADFYNCIIGHYEVDLKHPRRDRERGRIWRIVYKGDDAKATPAPQRGDFTKLDSRQLVAALGNPNLAVRIRAGNLLAIVKSQSERNEVYNEILRRAADPYIRAHGAWVIERLGMLDAPTIITLAGATDDARALLNVHLVRIMAERPNWDTGDRSLVLREIEDSDPLVRRCAMEALGRHPTAQNFAVLLDARERVDTADTHMLHVARMALRNMAADGAAFQALADKPSSFGLRRPQDQWSAVDLSACADVMPGVHTPESARWLIAYLEKHTESPENVVRYEHAISRYGDDADARNLVAFARAHEHANRGLQVAQLRAIHQGLQERGGPLPAEARGWATELATSLLKSNDPNERGMGTELAGEFRLGEATDALAALAVDRLVEEPQRLKALQALLTINADDAVAPLATVLQRSDDPISLREQAATLLGQSGRRAARTSLLEALPIVPTRLQTAIAAALAAEREGGEALLTAFEQGKASAGLAQAPAVIARLKAAGIPNLDKRLADLTANLPPADQATQALIDNRMRLFAKTRRDPSRGREVFKQKCAACHQIQNEGGKVGPQLDGVGARGPERIMEDILDPNRNVDQAFRASTLALDDGRVVTGLVLRDPGEVVVLADSEGKEVSIAKKSIEERKVVPLSPMPANMSEQVNDADFCHLVEFLLSHREKPK